MLVSALPLLEEAYRGRNRAVGAFNAETWDMVCAVVDGLESCGAPGLLAITPATLQLYGWDRLARHARAVAEAASVPVALHLDHATQVEDVQRALEHGFTSVMMDGSHLPMEENIRLTREAVERGHAASVPVEGEIGHVGRAGEPPHLAHLTAPEEAVRFAEATGVDSLAVAIGTFHGQARGPGDIDLGRLQEISLRVRVPLVLHGGSGVPREVLAQAIAWGISKVNIGTQLVRAWQQAVAERQGEKPRYVITAAQEAVARAVRERCAWLG